LQRRLERIRIDRISPVPAQIDHKSAEENLAQRLKGYLIADGVIQVEQRLPLNGRLGRHPLCLLRNSLQLPGEGREAHLRQVYIDTETTGLSGGSGTLAFLIGLAIVERDALVVTQYLITRFAGEAAMLKSFDRVLTTDDRLVSYNGKSFDLPFIERYFGIKLNQAHIDLRYVLASLGYKGGLKGCETRLGFHRGDLTDIDGFFAVLLWHDYRKNRNEKALQTLLAYNIQDVLSLEILMVIAYNLKIEDTPFYLNSLPEPVLPETPFDVDIDTVKRIRSEQNYLGLV